MLLQLAFGFAALTAPIQLTPAPPSGEEVFGDPNIADEIKSRCARAGAPGSCALATRNAIERLRLAYVSPATTVDQRVKVLTLIDADRARNDVDWTGIANSYFAWRAAATGDTSLASAEDVFDSPIVEREVTARCAKTMSGDTCILSTQNAIARLRSAYASRATTAVERAKILGLIDADRRRQNVDWTGISSGYFAWRANNSGEAEREIQNLRDKYPPRFPTTVETRCYNSRYSSRCTTTTR